MDAGKLKEAAKEAEVALKLLQSRIYTPEEFLTTVNKIRAGINLDPLDHLPGPNEKII